jgi:hypothetical protein
LQRRRRNFGGAVSTVKLNAYERIWVALLSGIVDMETHRQARSRASPAQKAQCVWIEMSVRTPLLGYLEDTNSANKRKLHENTFFAEILDGIRGNTSAFLGATFPWWNLNFFRDTGVDTIDLFHAGC